MTGRDGDRPRRVGVAQWTPGRDPGGQPAHGRGRRARARPARLPARGAARAVAVRLPHRHARRRRTGGGRAARRPGPTAAGGAGRATPGWSCAPGASPNWTAGSCSTPPSSTGQRVTCCCATARAACTGPSPTSSGPETPVTVGDIAGIGRVGLCICFDGDFPETARALRARGRRPRAAPVRLRGGRRELVGHHLPGPGAMQRPVVDRRQPARRQRRRPDARRQPDHRPGRADRRRRAAAPRLSCPQPNCSSSTSPSTTNSPPLPPSAACCGPARAHRHRTSTARVRRKPHEPEIEHRARGARAPHHRRSSRCRNGTGNHATCSPSGSAPTSCR